MPAEEELDVLDDVELLEVEEDNARDLTTGLVITTFGLLLLAWVLMEAALGKWYDVGPFGG